MADTIMEIKLDAGQLIGTAATAGTALMGLTKVANELGEAIDDAFTIGGYKDYLKTVRRFGKGLTDELLVLQLQFGSMKAAIADACAPLAAVFVPMLNNAIAAITNFAGQVGQFFRGMVIGITGRDALAESAQKAADSEDKLTESVKRSGRAAKKSLMAFDQINRLNGGSGGGSSSAQTLLPEFNLEPISQQVQAVVDKVMAFLRPLLEIDLLPLQTALQGLWGHLQTLVALLGQALEWLWFQVLTPFIEWVIEQLAPALTDQFGSAVSAVTAILEPLMAGIQALWQALQPVVAYIGTKVLEVIGAWKAAFENLAAVFEEKNPKITGILQNIATVLSVVWNAVKPVLNALSNLFGATFENLAAFAAAGTGHVIDALYALTSALAGAFTGNWAQAWEGVKGVVKAAVNGIIGFLNAMLSGIGGALNSIVRAANSLSFTLPEWIPAVGGKSFSPNLRSVSVGQIPKLAQGAVLPANRPFLAVVGDQRHGTNIEAPLSTIQEAMAAVMADSVSSNMAGHEATVAVLQKILQAVLAVELGDEVIGTAAERYSRRMAMMKGV